MPDEQKISIIKPRRAPTLYFIIVFKLMKALGLVAIAFGFYSLRNKNIPDVFDNFLRWLHLDPEQRFFAAIGDRLDDLTPEKMKHFAMGAGLYSLLLFAEGLGLAFRFGWAVWLAVGQSAFFIPIEVREIIIHDHASKTFFSLIFLLCLNVLIVWYLYVNRNRLIVHHHHHH